jgi:hypothetical protein
MLNQVEICNNFILFLNFSVFLFLIKETTKKNNNKDAYYWRIKMMKIKIKKRKKEHPQSMGPKCN